MYGHLFFMKETLDSIKLKYGISKDTDLAKFLCVSKRTLSRWRTGKSEPTAKHKVKLNKVLNSDPGIKTSLDRLSSGAIDESIEETETLINCKTRNSVLLALTSVALKTSQQINSLLRPALISVSLIYGTTIANSSVRVTVALAHNKHLYVDVLPKSVYDGVHNGISMVLYGTNNDIIYFCDLTDKNLLSLVNKARKYKASIIT